MDPLAHILSSIRLKSPLLGQVRLGRDVSLTVSDPGALPYALPQALKAAAPFHYVERGRCRLVTSKVQIDLEAGDTVMFPRWPAYSLETGEACNVLAIAEVALEGHQPLWTLEYGQDVSLEVEAGEPPFEAELLGGFFAFDSTSAGLLLNDLPELIHISGGSHGVTGLLTAELEFMRKDGGARPGYTATAVRLLEVLLIEILRSWASESQHAPGRLRGMLDPRLAQVFNAMHAKPGCHWTLEKLAAVAGQSRSGFARYFATVVGATPGAYLAEWRCQLAERRLVASDESISQIACDLGYESSFAFTRMFRRLKGVTPKRFRMQRRERSQIT